MKASKFVATLPQQHADAVVSMQQAKRVLAIMERDLRGKLELAIGCLSAAEDRLDGIVSILVANGCDCDCECPAGEHGDECEICVPCQINSHLRSYTRTTKRAK